MVLLEANPLEDIGNAKELLQSSMDDIFQKMLYRKCWPASKEVLTESIYTTGPIKQTKEG
jgi:hypothetical protein